MPKRNCSDILKALSDKSRVRIVKALLKKPRGVNDLSEALEISQYNVSKHLRVLRTAGILEVRPDGPRREYHVVEGARKHIAKEGRTLDFGCCTFDFDRLTE